MPWYPTCTPAQLPRAFTVYVSRNCTVGELQMKVAISLQAHSTTNNKDPVAHLLEWSRIWKVDSS